MKGGFLVWLGCDQRLFQQPLRRLKVLFPGKDQSKAREIICGMPSYFPKDPAGLERIRFALLKLSNGDIEQLEEWKDELRSDYRNVAR